MAIKLINPTNSSYSQAMELINHKRIVFVSGQIPVDVHNNVPTDFRTQCELVWKNIEKQLIDAEMTLLHIVKITTFLSDRKYKLENEEIRNKTMGIHQPALTVIIADIYDEKWLLEIEVTAAE